MARVFANALESRLESASGSVPVTTGTRAMFAWYRATANQSVSSRAGIVTLRTSASAGDSLVIFNPTTPPAWSSDNVGSVSCPAGSYVVNNTWGCIGGYHAVGGSVGVAANNSVLSTGSLGTPPTADTVVLGNYTLAPSLPYTGELCWVAMWNTTLTIEQIQGLMRGQHPYMVARNNLVFFAPLRAGPGETEYDLVGGIALPVASGGTVNQADSIPIRGP